MSARLGAEQPPAAFTKFAFMNFSPLFISTTALTYVYLSILILVVKLALPIFGVKLNLETEGYDKYINPSDKEKYNKNLNTILFNNNGLHASGTDYKGGTINISTNLGNFPFANVTTLKFSKFPYATHLNNPSPNTAQNILAEHLNLKVIIYYIENPNIYGIFKVTSFAQDSSNTNFYDMGLTHVSSNGNLCCTPLADLYIIEPWAQDGDLHYTHVQNSASSTWTINHNLGKIPAVQAFTGNIPNGQQFEADIEHVNNNQCKIYLSADNSGYVYCN